MRPPRHYEFPTGFNSVFSSERFVPGEVYFSHHHLGVRYLFSFDGSWILTRPSEAELAAIAAYASPAHCSMLERDRARS